MKLKFLGAGAALASGCIAMTLASARADVIYTYTGNHFASVSNENAPPAPQYTKTDSVSGNFTLLTALGDNLPLTTIAPTSFSFTDGVQTLTNSTPGVGPVGFQIATNAAGLPLDWSIVVNLITSIISERIDTQTISGVIDIGEQSTPNGDTNGGVITNTLGMWTVSTVPAPVAGAGGPGLLAAGLAFLVWRGRSAAMALFRRRQRLFAPVAS